MAPSYRIVPQEVKELLGSMHQHEKASCGDGQVHESHGELHRWRPLGHVEEGQLRALQADMTRMRQW